MPLELAKCATEMASSEVSRPSSIPAYIYELLLIRYASCSSLYNITK